MTRLFANRWLAGVLVVLLAVGIGFEIRALADDGGGTPSAPAASRDVARKFAVAVTSFDHKRIDQDLARVLAFGTSGFEREFRTAMGPNFIEGIKANKRVSKGTVVVGPSVQRTAKGRAAFLVVVAQQIVSEGSDAAPQSLTVPMLLTVSTDSSPKVENVEVL